MVVSLLLLRRSRKLRAKRRNESPIEGESCLEGCAIMDDV